MKRNKKQRNKADGKRRASKADTLETYRALHDDYHNTLRRERFGRKHEAYDFPLLLRDSVCVADPELGHAPGIIIDNLPENLFQKDVLDMGCGTGVLSLAAAYRGANVIATDIDNKALHLTEENIGLNPQVAKQITVFHSDLFNGVKRQLPQQRFDIITANLWFPVNDPKSRNAKQEALECYRQFFGAVRGLLKPDGIACIPINDFADTDATMEIMGRNGIKPHIAHAYKNHFGGQVGVNWRLYSFDKLGQPARLNR